MHEYALAEAVVSSALEFAEQEGLSELTGVVVRIGELQVIELSVFEFALQEILPATEPRLAGVTFTLEAEPAKLRCRPCGREFTLAETGGPKSEEESEAIHFVPELAHAFLRCPGCQSPGDMPDSPYQGYNLHSLLMELSNKIDGTSQS